MILIYTVVVLILAIASWLIQRRVARLERKVKALTRSMPDEDMRPSDFARANRFLGQLRDTRRLLQEPDAGAYLLGKHAARGQKGEPLCLSLPCVSSSRPASTSVTKPGAGTRR